MQKDFNDISLAESHVSLKLVDIQKRCTQLMEESGDALELELALEEPVLAVDDSNPYDHG